MKPEKKGNNALIIGAVMVILLAGIAYAVLSGDSTPEKQTAAPAPSTDLSVLSLPENFNSLSDGLKLIPPGITWAYFANLKQGIGIEQNFMHDINTTALPFADMSYFGLIKSGNDIKGEIAFRIRDNGIVPLTKYNELKNSSVVRGFRSYEVQKENNTLVIKMTSDLNNIISEATQNYKIEI